MDDIFKYEGLVWSIVNKYSNYFDKDDLYQVGIIGLLNAYKNYDNSQNTKFSTYAYTYIFGEIYRYVNDSNLVKVSKEINKLYKSITTAKDKLRQTLMREPTDFELSVFLDIDINDIAVANYSKNVVTSIDDSYNEMCLLDTMGEEDDNLNIDNLNLRFEIENLSNEEKNIIYSRYYNDKSQQEVSSDLGISQVQVSRKEAKVLQKLKNKL